MIITGAASMSVLEEYMKTQKISKGINGLYWVKLTGNFGILSYL